MAKSDKAAATKFVTELSTRGGDRAAAKLLPLVYDQLRDLAKKYLKREREGHTLQPTALVHEVFLKMIDQKKVDWRGRTHFYAVCAEAMRRILIDHARGRKRVKRGGAWQKVALDEGIAPAHESEIDAVDLHEALDNLSKLDPRQARIVELRFLAGLSVEEVAEVLGVSKRTVEGDWTHAKAWLRTELGRPVDE